MTNIQLKQKKWHLLSLLIINVFAIFYIYSHNLKTKHIQKPIPKPVQINKCQNKNCVLKNYSINELTIKGNITGNKHKWAFIETPEGKIVKTNIDDLIGKEHIKVKNIGI